MKKYYFRSLTDWTSSDNKEHKKILWFKYGGQKRGHLNFEFFNNEIEAIQFCKSLNMVME